MGVLLSVKAQKYKHFVNLSSELPVKIRKKIRIIEIMLVERFKMC